MLAFHLRSLRATASLWPLLPAALLLAPAVAAHAQTQPVAEETQEVIVTGTREKGRTKYESLTPVDVISARAVQDGASAASLISSWMSVRASTPMCKARNITKATAKPCAPV